MRKKKKTNRKKEIRQQNSNSSNHYLETLDASINTLSATILNWSWCMELH